MKTIKLLLVVTLVNVLQISNLNAGAGYELTNKNLFNFYNIADDANLIVTIIQSGSEVSVHISYNGNEGTLGTLKIYNESNQLVSQFDGVEIKHLPDYSSINLSEYASGNYTFELTTNVGVHITHATI